VTWQVCGHAMEVAVIAVIIVAVVVGNMMVVGKTVAAVRMKW